MPYGGLEAGGGKPIEIYLFRRGTQAWAYTSSESMVQKDEFMYVPSPIQRSGLSINEEARSNNLTLTVPPDHPIVAMYARFTPAETISLTVFRRQLEDVEDEWVTLFSGQVSSCTIVAGSGEIMCVPFESVIEKRLLPVIAQPNCNNRLYDQRCQVDPAAWTFEMPVAAISYDLTFGHKITLGGTAATTFADDATTDSTNPAFWLNAGVALFDTQIRMITFHTGVDIFILEPFLDLEVGDTITVRAGCNKVISTCRDKFDNLPRFLGFPFMPNTNPFGEQGIV